MAFSCLSGVHRPENPDSSCSYLAVDLAPGNFFFSWVDAEENYILVVLYAYNYCCIIYLYCILIHICTSASYIKNYNGILRAFSGPVIYLVATKYQTLKLTITKIRLWNKCIAMPYNNIIVMEKCYWHFGRKKRISNSKCDDIFINSSASP